MTRCRWALVLALWLGSFVSVPVAFFVGEERGLWEGYCAGVIRGFQKGYHAGRLDCPCLER